MQVADYNVICLLCSREAGQILAGRFVRHADCPTPLSHTGRRPRCCHCGGSVYLEAITRADFALLDKKVAGRAG